MKEASLGDLSEANSLNESYGGSSGSWCGRKGSGGWLLDGLGQCLLGFYQLRVGLEGDTEQSRFGEF